MECSTVKRTTITEIKKKAKQGETVRIMILPSKIKPYSGSSISESVHELEYEDGKFIVYSRDRHIWSDLASTVHWWKVATCIGEQGKTLKFYEV